MDAIIIFFASKLHIGIVLVGVLFCALLSNKRRVFFAYKASIALPVAFVLGRFASLVISSPRPFVVENIQPLIAHIPNNGFPSEHTLLVATISALVYTESKVVGVIIGVLAISVGIARVLANVHHSVDVVGSVGIAVFAVVISFYLVRLLQTLYADRLPFLQKNN
jgi:undecaprenyl-diphosphatase